MKKLLKISAPLILALTLLIGNSSCSKECGLALSDLITDLTLTTVGTVQAGQPVEFSNLITNVPDLISKCKKDIMETVGSGNSKSRLMVDYDPTGNGEYRNEVNQLFSTNSIPANSAYDDNYQVSLNEPGYYKIQTFADDLDEVEERVETNNASNTINVNGLRVSGDRGVEPMIIQVLPNPDFIKPEGTPTVQILSRTTTLISK